MGVSTKKSQMKWKLNTLTKILRKISLCLYDMLLYTQVQTTELLGTSTINVHI
jgi:hypothetical protein